MTLSPPSRRPVELQNFYTAAAILKLSMTEEYRDVILPLFMVRWPRGPDLSRHCATIRRMADDEDWYKPNRPPRPARQPTPGEHVWSLRKGGKQIDCELRFQGESYGWECQCLHDGVLAYGQPFVLREGAMAEAEAQRQRLAREGWVCS